MKTFGLNYDVKPERLEEFKTYTKSVLEAVKGFEGHVETRLYADAFEPTSMMIYSNWETVEQFRAFTNSEAFKKSVGDTRGMLRGLPRHKVYDDGGDLV